MTKQEYILGRPSHISGEPRISLRLSQCKNPGTTLTVTSTAAGKKDESIPHFCGISAVHNKPDPYCSKQNFTI